MTTNNIFEVVRNDLTVLEAELLSVIQSPVELITDISSHLVQAGGKRLRPALYFICARACCADMAKMLPMAVAIELIHMATLVHDDVIDNAATRRGRPTANVCWGNHQSVLTGDYLFAKAFQRISSNVNSEMLRVLTDVICSLCEGEIVQHRDSFSPTKLEDEYLIRIAKKTADFIAASCQLGGMTAEMSDEDIKALRDYGYAVGMAFQITDDILDITASSEQIGKPAGNDLRQGIVTMPVIYALNHSKDSAELHSIVMNRALTDQQVARGLAIIHETQAVEYSYQRVADYLNFARKVLPKTVLVELREALINIADFVEMRKF